MKERIANICFIISWILSLVGLMLGVWHKDVNEVAYGLVLILLAIVVTYDRC